jgi:catechol 2,3-dioxygenase-like lactoylglutathione lyase family enzyme
MTMRVEKISAITFRVASMAESVRSYRDVLGMETIYGGEGEFFSSLRTKERAVSNPESGTG